MELREQFTLAPGVSQAMTSFKTKAPKESPTSSVSGEGRNGMTGPITKVSNNIYISGTTSLKFSGKLILDP